MTTKEFLDKYDSKQDFTEDELYRIWINNIEDDFEEEFEKPHR